MCHPGLDSKEAPTGLTNSSRSWVVSLIVDAALLPSLFVHLDLTRACCRWWVSVVSVVFW